MECKDQTALYWYAYMHMEYNNYHLHNLADTSILALSEFKHVMIDEHDGVRHLRKFCYITALKAVCSSLMNCMIALSALLNALIIGHFG